VSLIQTTIRLDSDLHKRLRHAVADRELRSIQQAVLQALEAWLQEEQASPPAEAETPPAGALQPESEWHRKLSAILASGDEDVIRAVTQNIDVFYDRLKPARAAEAGGRRKSG